jgi:hypothetical protein
MKVNTQALEYSKDFGNMKSMNEFQESCAGYSDSFEDTKIKILFDEDSSDYQHELKKAHSINQKKLPDNSFRLKLSKIKEFDHLEIEKVGGENNRQLGLQDRFLDPITHTKQRKYNIFENILKTPQHNSKPFTHLILKKHCNISKFKHNLSTGDLPDIQRSPSSTKTSSNEFPAYLISNKDRNNKLYFNFSTIQEKKPDFSFEPDMADSDMLYEVKLQNTPITMEVNRPINIHVKKIENNFASLNKPIEIICKSEGNNSEMLNKKDKFNSLNSMAIGSNSHISSHQANYQFVKTELRNLFQEQFDDEASVQNTGFLNRMLCCSKATGKRCEVNYFFFLSKLHPGKKKSKHQKFYRLVNVVSKIFIDVVTITFLNNINEAGISYNAKNEACQLTNTKNERLLHRRSEFLKDLKVISFADSNSRHPYGSLYLMTLVEFIFEFPDIYLEILSILIKKDLSFSSTYSKVFDVTFKSYKKILDQKTNKNVPFDEFKTHFSLSFILCMNKMKECTVSESLVERICASFQKSLLSHPEDLAYSCGTTDRSSLTNFLKSIRIN